jgi:hypothetical protein
VRKQRVVRYEGSWLQNYAHGKGMLTYHEGDKYVGDWVEGAVEEQLVRILIRARRQEARARRAALC